MIASVFSCPGTNSTVPDIGPPSCCSTDTGQWVAHQLVHHPLAAERRLHEHHPWRLRLHLADLHGALAARHGAQRRQRRLGAPPAPRRRRACPRWPRTSGRCRGSPRRRPPPAPPARRPRARSSPTPEARASSLSTEATPPRVASRRQRSLGPAASSSASTAGHSEHVSDSTARVELELAAREHDRRAVVADRARDDDAVARAQARRRQRCARVDGARPRRCRGTSGRRARARRPWCRRRRSRRRPPRRRAAIASTSARRTSAGEALLEHHREAERQRPRAGDGEVVDRAVDRQLADRAAGEADRLDDEAVGRQRDVDAADRDACRRRRAPRAPASRRRARRGPR